MTPVLEYWKYSVHKMSKLPIDMNWLGLIRLNMIRLNTGRLNTGRLNISWPLPLVPLAVALMTSVFSISATAQESASQQKPEKAIAEDLENSPTLKSATQKKVTKPAVKVGVGCEEGESMFRCLQRQREELVLTQHRAAIDALKAENAQNLAEIGRADVQLADNRRKQIQLEAATRILIQAVKENRYLPDNIDGQILGIQTAAMAAGMNGAAMNSMVSKSLSDTIMNQPQRDDATLHTDGVDEVADNQEAQPDALGQEAIKPDQADPQEMPQGAVKQAVAQAFQVKAIYGLGDQLTAHLVMQHNGRRDVRRVRTGDKIGRISVESVMSDGVEIMVDGDLMFLEVGR